MNKPLISVIVPIYSTDRYTGKCIESIINQSYTNLEIILVDDGSKDRCPELCDLYANKDSRIKVIHKINAGLVAARKTGLKESHGKYITYVDGDDWIGTGFIQSMYDSIIASKADIVVSGWTRTLFEKRVNVLNNTSIGIYEGEKLENLYSNMMSDDTFFVSKVSSFLWNKMFKREIVYNFQMSVDERIMIGEDASVSYPAILESKAICITDCTEYYYRQHIASMLKASTNYEEQKIKLKALYDYMTSLYHDERWVSQVEDYVLASFIIRFGALNINDIYESFDGKYIGKKVVIFSAGTFGQKIVSGILHDGRCELAGWIDDDFWEYRRFCLDVDPVESIMEKDFDYILIAAVDGSYSKEARKRLVFLGVPENKILTMNPVEKVKKELLEYYLNGCVVN